MSDESHVSLANVTAAPPSAKHLVLFRDLSLTVRAGDGGQVCACVRACVCARARVCA